MDLREERLGDHTGVDRVHKAAFGDFGESIVALVDDLREHLTRHPGLSLVADDANRVVAHAMFTRQLLDAQPRLVDVQVMAPVGVLPERQRQGTGKALIEHGVEQLVARGVPLVFVEGDPAYYTRLGFVSAVGLGFRKPSLRTPDPAFMVRLLPAYEAWMTGTLVYCDVFWKHDAVGLRNGGGAPPQQLP